MQVFQLKGLTLIVQIGLDAITYGVFLCLVCNVMLLGNELRLNSIRICGLQIPVTFVFTKCDKMKVAKGKRPDENIKDFQEIIKQNYKQHPPWIMTSSVTGLGRDDLLLHVSQLRNYWDQ
jgi:hypothetical protein